MRQLPAESAFATALRIEQADQPAPRHAAPEPDPEAEQWSRTDLLIAAMRDEVHFLRYAYTTAHYKNIKWKPEPLPRPGVSSRARRRPLVNEEQSERLWAHLQIVAPPSD